MPIVFARVDDRLVHGQIVQAWLPMLGAEEVLIPFSKGEKPLFSRGLLRLSLPYEYELTVLDTAEAVRHVSSCNKKIFLLVNSLNVMTDLIKDGLQISSVNIGGMHFKPDAQKLADHVYLSKADKKSLKLIRDLGINIETRAVPTDVSVAVNEVLRDA